VLDGFVIERSILEQAPLKAAKGRMHVLKKHSLAISISVFVHLLLAFSLFFIAEQQQPKQVEITNKAIKSYLYKMPDKLVIVEPKTVKQVPEEVKIPEKIKIEKKPDELKKESANQTVSKKENNLKMSESSKVSSLTKSKSKSKSKTTTKKAVQANFSSYKQLDSLRNSINKRIIEQGASDFQQFRSPSVMHGDQIPVPHSNVQLTPEQEREKKITRMSDDISITKYDNGLCTVERKQFLGSPIEGTTSAFACGESKFDKSFREHMQKVQDKIMPKR